PAGGATGVATSVAPSATFSRAMDASTITSSSFTLTGPFGAVTATVGCNNPCTTATLTPTSALANGATYTASLDTTVKAADGAPLATAHPWSYTTATGPPPVTSTPPTSGATGIATNVTPTATFSRAMDSSTITNASFTLTPQGGSPIAASVSYNAVNNTA